MAQAKRKTATKTAKKPAARKTQCHKKACSRTAKKSQSISSSERMHVYVVTGMAIITGVLLCANAAMMMV